jgi:hypothetical protein
VTDLTKWPLLLVSGEPVTEEQANEILVRTNSYFMGNDREWVRFVRKTFGLPEEEWVPREIQDPAERLAWWREHNRKEDEARAALGLLDLEYLYNDRITSSWIGGPHGWCNWNGEIGTANYNIGKWPTVEEVTEEWQLIATSFPYLDLTAQLVTDEGEGELAAEWRVQRGEVIFNDAPTEQIRPQEDLAEGAVLSLLAPGGERGLDPGRLIEAVRQVREKMR